MSSEMRECPFCGNQPRSGWQGTGVPGMDDCGYWEIDCCNAFVHADTEAEALAQWNRRSDAPNGSWLWCKLMDFCQKRRFPPAEFNDLFAIVTEAHELNNRALLARTEAGADGAVWMYRHAKRVGPWSTFHNEQHRANTERDPTWEVRAFYPHPQDASGDAEVEVEWVVTSSCAGPNGHPKFDSEAAAFAHFAENSEIPSYLNPTRKRQAQVYVRRTELTDVTSKAIAAMQAKEAK